MRTVSRSKAAIGAGLLALLLLWTASSVRADSGTDAAGCLAIVGGPTGQAIAGLANGKTPLASAAKAASTAARYTENKCALYSENYVYLGIAAALTGLVAAGQLPNDYDQLSGKLDGLIGAIVADILKAALADPSSPLHGLAMKLPSGWLDKLNQYIAEGAADKIVDLLNENPVTAQFMGFFNCGAVVATSGVADQTKQLLIDNPKSCYAFLSTCSKSVAACIGGVVDLGEDIATGISHLPGEVVDGFKAGVKGAVKAAGAAADAPADVGLAVECGLGTPCLTPGVQDPTCYAAIACQPGVPFSQCAAAASKSSCASTDITCNLDGGGFYTALSDVAMCKCPDPQGYTIAGGKATKCALCPSGQAVDPTNGQCRTRKSNEVLWSGYWKSCAPGDKAYPEFGLCGPVCDGGLGQKIAKGAGGTLYCRNACEGISNGVYDPVLQQCHDCTKDKAVAGGGVCNACGNGTKFDFTKINGARCIPSCAFGAVTDPVTGKCSNCGAGKIAVYKDGSNKTSSAGSCLACNALLEKNIGNRCVPILNCENWQTLAAKGGVAACVNKCPAGQKFTAAVKGSAGGIQTDQAGNKVGIVPVLGSPEKCEICGGQNVLDPLTNECRPCEAGKVWTGSRDGFPASCAARPQANPVNIPKPQAPVGRPIVLPTPNGARDVPASSCPPGRVRNAAGRCVAAIDDDEGFRGGSGRPGAAGGQSGGAPAVVRSPSIGSKPYR